MKKLHSNSKPAGFVSDDMIDAATTDVSNQDYIQIVIKVGISRYVVGYH